MDLSAFWTAAEKKGWGSDMLPVVPFDKDTKTTLSSLGKTPSVLNAKGEAVGLKGWPTMEVTDKQRRRWASAGYGICFRTGRTVAFDCDVDDPVISGEIETVFNILIGQSVPVRRRAGSSRWLAVLRIDAPLPKQRAVLPSGDAVEILGQGQQFVAVGVHPSGAAYTWSPALPVFNELPVISADTVQMFLDDIKVRYSAELTKSRLKNRPDGKTAIEPDALADWLRDNGYVLDESDGILNIVCPWSNEHSGENKGSSTSYFQRGVNGRHEPGFKCLHAHCAHRGYPELLQWARSQGFDDNKTSLPIVKAEVVDDENLTRLFGVLKKHQNAQTGQIAARLPTVIAALQIRSYCRVDLAYDTFTGGVVYKDIQSDKPSLRGDHMATDWEPFSESEAILMRERLEREFDFSPINRELMRDAVSGVANGGISTVDTMVEYMQKRLPIWDGVKRCERFFADYCGCEDDEYSAELGRYVFAALAGRALSPQGVKADIVPVLIGRQGTYKSTLISKLALRPGTARELSFTSKDDDIRRLIRGASVVEVPEMSGLARREANDVKFFLSLDADTWIPKYREGSITLKRRCVFFATTNEQEFLNDATGSRRFAPINTGDIRINEISEIIPQLWAEGRQIFTDFGIPHRKLEAMARERAPRFELRDPWADAVGNYLANVSKMSDAPVLTTHAIFEHALGMTSGRVKMADSRRVGNILRAFGYRNRFSKVNGRTVRSWEKDK